MRKRSTNDRRHSLRGARRLQRTTAERASSETGRDATSASVTGFNGKRACNGPASAGERDSLARDDLGDGQPAISPLARPHAASRIALRLVGAGAPFAGRAGDRGGGHFLAAAGDGVALRECETPSAGRYSASRKRRPRSACASARRSGRAIAIALVARKAPVRIGQRERREAAADRRRLRARDPGAVARDVDAGHARAAPRVDNRAKAGARIVPLDRAAERRRRD